MASVCSIWLVTDIFSNQELRTFSHIRAHQSTSEKINTSLCRRKTKSASVNYFAIVVLSTNKTYGAFTWRLFVFSVLRGTTWFKNNFHHNVKGNLCHFSTNIPAFFPLYWLTGGRYRCLQSSNDSDSHLIYLVFRWYCCDRKSRAAYAQSFALWQQATIEFTCHDHSIIACSRHIYVWCCSPRTSRSWWITQSMQHHRRVCNNCSRTITLSTTSKSLLKSNKKKITLKILGDWISKGFKQESPKSMSWVEFIWR